MQNWNDVNNGDLNPKVQIELEKLNTASAQINEFENKLQELRNTFNETLSKCSSNLCEISNKVGSAIPRARPYFELKRSQIEMQRENQVAASRYETACIELNHANSVVSKSESLAKESNKLDDSAMEILNIAIAKVNLAKKEKTEAHREHQRFLSLYMEIDEKIHQQERRHKHDIKKSMDYFHYSKVMEDKLKEDKLGIEVYEEKIKICKAIYNDSLQRLEEISNKIHEERGKKDMLGPRGQGVGAEQVSDDPTEKPMATVKNPVDLETQRSQLSKQQSDVSETASIVSTAQSRQKRRRASLASSTPLVDGLLRAASASTAHCVPRRAPRRPPPSEAPLDSPDSGLSRATSVDEAGDRS